MIGSLEIRSRPIKLGFIVNPRRVRSIEQAIKISSSLWGGAHNPIIPLYGIAPHNWEIPFPPPKAKTIVQGYIDAFDPDVLVQCTPVLPEYVKKMGLELISPSEIWQPLDKKELAPRYGIGVFELYNEIYEKHFRYQEKYSVKVTLPKIPKTYSLFWNSVFGSLPANVASQINPKLKKILEISSPRVTPQRLGTLLKGNVLFPRRLTQYGLEYRSRSGHTNYSCIFFMDATKNLDIIDYWNLRALGKHVIPVPIQLTKEQSLKDIVTDFVYESHQRLRYRSHLHYYTDFIRSRNTKMEDMATYAKSLNISQNSPNESAYALQHWYPRIWSDWARDRDGAMADDLFHQEETIDITETETKPVVLLKPMKPLFAFENYFYSDSRVANEINFNLYGTKDFFPRVFPKNGGNNLIRAVTGAISERDEWRVGRNGLVKFVKDQYTDRWNIPLAQDTFTSWMKDRGWNIEISTPGLLARQIYKQLDGSVGTLINRKLLELFEHMNGGNRDNQGKVLSENNEREKAVGTVKSELQQMRGSRHLYDFLIEKNVFRIGAKVQCPNCKRHSWYSLENLKESITCPRCLNSFAAVGNLENAGSWHYKTSGPFSVPNFADGAYCVLISIYFFDHHLHNMKIAPAYSFNGQNSLNKSLEADFGILWKESTHRGIMEGVLFGECKTFGIFKREDFQRMRKIAKAFPGAILAFCTLRADLTAKEKREITKLAKIGRKQLKVEVPTNPVMILTGKELLSDNGAPYCWKERSDYKKYERVFGLLEIVNATQQIHLGLPPWEDDWRKEAEEKRKKSKSK